MWQIRQTWMIDTLCVSVDFSTPQAEAWRTHRLIYSALIGVRDAKCIVVLDVVETRHELEWTIRAYRDSRLTDRPPSSGEQNTVRLFSQERTLRAAASIPLHNSARSQAALMAHSGCSRMLRFLSFLALLRYPSERNAAYLANDTRISAIGDRHPPDARLCLSTPLTRRGQSASRRLAARVNHL